MLVTPRQHFDHDISRARALLAQAESMPAGEVHDDVLRAAWMMAIGASDAYFSDAYADLVSRALRAKELEPTVEIPERLNSLKIPVRAVLRHQASGWRWRMAARELVETDSVLSFEKIRRLLNQFMRETHKLLSSGSLESWILDPHAKKRVFGINAAEYNAKTPAQRTDARKKAMKHMEERYTGLIQRRHDCIHNCDRPKTALQSITAASTRKCIADIEFLVGKCQGALLAEFDIYLKGLGFCGATRNQVMQ